MGIVSWKKALADGHSAALARTRSEQKESASCHRSAARASWKRKKSMFAWRYSAECLGGGQMGCPPKTWSVIAAMATSATRKPRRTFSLIFIGLLMRHQTLWTAQYKNIRKDLTQKCEGGKTQSRSSKRVRPP